MKDWRTTLGGLLGGIGATLQGSADPTLHWGGTLILAIAVIFLGYHAMDKS